MNAIDKMSMLNKSIDIFNYAIRIICVIILKQKIFAFAYLFA